MSENCENCKFYSQKYQNAGICRRYAPRPSASDEYFWPSVGASDWCGEHKSRPTPYAPETAIASPTEEALQEFQSSNQSGIA